MAGWCAGVSDEGEAGWKNGDSQPSPTGSRWDLRRLWRRRWWQSPVFPTATGFVLRTESRAAAMGLAGGSPVCGTRRGRGRAWIGRGGRSGSVGPGAGGRIGVKIGAFPTILTTTCSIQQRCRHSMLGHEQLILTPMPGGRRSRGGSADDCRPGASGLGAEGQREGAGAAGSFVPARGLNRTVSAAVSPGVDLHHQWALLSMGFVTPLQDNRRLIFSGGHQKLQQNTQYCLHLEKGAGDILSLRR